MGGLGLNKILTGLTLAGLGGLLILNGDKAVSVIDSLSKATNSYVQTVQGRG